VPERRTPYFLSTTLIPSIFVFVFTSGNGRNGGSQRKNMPLGCMLRNLKKGFSGD
jgi:hypothetical protein